MADLYAKYACSYCQEEINGLRVRCAECIDFDICLQCFSAGAEIGSHRNDHSYQLMESGAVGIFQGRGSWSAKEEVRLLDAIEQFGFGNWEDISKHIETRSPEDAKDEYISRYLEGSIGRATWGSVESTSRPSLHCAERDEGPLGPSAVGRLPPLAITPDEASQLGYMPNRDDFEREHDHDAEQIISTLSMNPEDDDLDVALKLSQVDMYTRRLRERTRRKRLVRDYQLVAAFFNNMRNKQRPLGKLAKEKKDFLDRLRAYAQFYARAEHAALTAGMWRERELRLRLAELYRYRLAGVTCAEECAHYEQHAAQRKQPHGVGLPVCLYAQWVHGNGHQQPAQRHARSPSHSSPKKKRRRKRLKFHQPKVHTGRKYRMWMLQKALMQQQQQRIQTSLNH